jgi:hypothetical protein
MNPNRAARMAGFLYLIAFMAGIFAELYVRDSLVVPGDAATTVANILASETLFRLGFVVSLIRQVVLILLALVLYILFQSVNKNQALLMVVLVLVSVPISMVSLQNQSAVLSLLNGAGYLKVFTAEQLQAQVMYLLDLQILGGMVAQLLAAWLLPLGYLVFKSGFLPRILGVLLIIAGSGYLMDFVIFFLFPHLDLTISLFTFWGEMLFPLWLLGKGVKVGQREDRQPNNTG